MKYPIGVQSFEVLREEGFVYIDKTDIIYSLAQQHVCFLCRPRRFGKSLTVSTLEAYFCGKKHLFENLKIYEIEKEWNEYPVFHIDFNGVDFSKTDALECVLLNYISNWEKEYTVESLPNVDLGVRLAAVIKKAHQVCNHRCVVLVDEYDKPILDALGDGNENRNRDILKSFYSVFKLADADLRFVLLTGVTKFSQVSVFSGFNQPNDISLDSDYEALCGVTESEIDTYFASSIEKMAFGRKISPELMRIALKNRYDGYHFSPRMTDVYNPFSLLNALSKDSLDNFWFSSGTPNYLLQLLSVKQYDIRDLLENYYAKSYFVDYKADVEDPLAMLYQSGYLSIKDVETQEDLSLHYKLDYPNMEVKQGFISLLANAYFSSKDDIPSVAKQMVYCLKEEDLDKLQLLMTSYLSSIDYVMRKDKEYHFHYTFYLIFSLLSSYSVKVEQHNSRGRADMVVETPNCVFIFEFKLDGTAKEALDQIEDRKYALPYALDSRKIYKIGASFGKKSGTIDDWYVVKD